VGLDPPWLRFPRSGPGEESESALDEVPAHREFPRAVNTDARYRVSSVSALRDDGGDMALVMTRSRRLTIVGAAAAALLVAVVLLNVTGRERIAETDETLPSAEFALFEGGTGSFDEFRGRPLVINFWASWCPACVNELPEFQAVHERLGDEVAFLGLANADRRGAAEALAAEVGLTYTLGDDPDGSLFRSLDLIAMPSTLFVSADGTIEEVFAGQLTEDALVERIDRIRGLS
jgi:thiol-disulfide isomerase/thioredoxin